MPDLIPIQYHKRKYPFDIRPLIREEAGHFDVKGLNIKSPISLHTEYSYGKRKYNSDIIQKFDILRRCHNNFVPKLWYNSDWAKEFSNFIISLTKSNNLLKIIEIHPPFNDYCSKIKDFIKIYRQFEKIIINEFSNTKILIEHRNGSLYKGGKFLISTSKDIIELTKFIKEYNLKLRIILDFPQLLSSEVSIDNISSKEISKTINTLYQCVDYIDAIHVWGKKKISGRWNAHIGDLNSLFNYNIDLKNIFLKEAYHLLNDGKIRYFVPEVNSNDHDLKSIVIDFINTGFNFNTNLNDSKRIIMKSQIINFSHPKSISKKWNINVLYDVYKWLINHNNKCGLGAPQSIYDTAIESRTKVGFITPEKNIEGFRYLLSLLHKDGYVNSRENDNLHYYVAKRANDEELNLLLTKFRSIINNK
jgi:hypothetical protein